MKIVVAGATGTLGNRVMDEVLTMGHDPEPVSRSSGVDLMTGHGLADKLLGASAVIDVSATSKISTKASINYFTNATRNLIEAERAAGVPHHVGISIIGAAQVNANYYAGKAAQEELLLAEARGWSLLRTTQFHEFAKQLVGHSKVGPLHLIPTMRSQPIAADEVATELVKIALGDPCGLAPDLAGPREENMAELVRQYLKATGQARRVIQVPLPGAWGRGMRDGTLLPPAETRRGQQTFDEWLAQQKD
ncbi:SDR family oxidoreductase [Rothia uropygialis]|uniref:SDR family oxidoreductase n=1 Tax=Kocuria sp. 36 TaxID=1415402 RepID=UPI00101D4A20|nr:SDR family oxidoreductase [Kocuria sp. 36]